MSAEQSMSADALRSIHGVLNSKTMCMSRLMMEAQRNFQHAAEHAAQNPGDAAATAAEETAAKRFDAASKRFDDMKAKLDDVYARWTDAKAAAQASACSAGKRE